MSNKWKMFPACFVVIFLLGIVPKVQAQKYIMTYLYGTGNYLEMVEERGDNFNELSPSYFDIDENGNLKLNHIDKTFVNKMKNKGIKVVPFLSNHWDRTIGRKAIQNYNELSSQIAEAVKLNGLDGVNVDIENLTEMDRENYTKLVEKLSEKLPKDKIISVSVAANPTGINIGWQGSYDYEKIAQYADYIMIMAYDEHYEGGSAGPVASIEFVEKSIQYALKKVEPGKIILGIPLYGRYWDLGTNTGGEAISLKRMDEILEKYNSKVMYDELSKSPKAIVSINPRDEALKIGGKVLPVGQYIFWYENEESVAKKLDLIEKYDIKGVGMWKIGLETQNVWTTITEKIGETIGEIKNEFNDVSQNHWAYEYINFVNEKGLMTGKKQNEFAAEDSLTRAELAAIITRVIEDKNINLESKMEFTGDFTDITKHWAKEYILQLQSLGIIKGYENNEFRPDNEVTRAEASVIISRLIENVEKLEYTYTSKNYLDITPSHWAYSEITRLGALGVLEGYENGTFRPENDIKRAEIAKIIQKIYEKIV